MEKQELTQQLVIYVKDNNGNNLEAGISCSSWEVKYGVRAGLVMEKCLGDTDEKVYIGTSEVNFKHKIIMV